MVSPPPPSPLGSASSLRPEEPLDILGVLALGVLVFAPFLDAQRGLPFLPCMLRAWTGLFCPLCGMTRAIISLIQGDLWRSLGLHPFGVPMTVWFCWRAFTLFSPTTRRAFHAHTSPGLRRLWVAGFCWMWGVYGLLRTLLS